MVPPTGIEPVRSFLRGILNPLRMPVSPRRQIFKVDRKNNWQNSRPTLLFNFQKAVNPQYTIIRGICHPKSSTDFKSDAYADFATAAYKFGGGGFESHARKTEKPHGKPLKRSRDGGGKYAKLRALQPRTQRVFGSLYPPVLSWHQIKRILFIWYNKYGPDVNCQCRENKRTV